MQALAWIRIQWAEVVVEGLHAVARRALSGKRLSGYLAHELRGQLMLTEAHVAVVDRLGRRRGGCLFEVVPQRFFGLPLLRETLALEGFRPAQVELYLASPRDSSGVALAAGGSVVRDRLASEVVLGLNHAPWTDPRLTGIVDQPDLTVAPATRRGLVPSRASEALALGLRTLEPILAARLQGASSEQTRQARSEEIARLQRAFQGLVQSSPRFSLLDVRGRAVAGGSSADANADPGGSRTDPEPPVSTPSPPGEDDELLGDPLFLDRVEVSPRSRPLIVEPLTERTLRAQAYDVAGRRIAAGLELRWTLLSPLAPIPGGMAEGGDALLRLDPEGSGARLMANAREGCASVLVEAWPHVNPDRVRSATLEVAVRQPGAGRISDGIPPPVFREDPASPWRSRLEGDRWEVNSGHRDFRLVKDDPRRRFQYLLTLCAKEIVLRCAGREASPADVMEDFLEVFAYASRHADSARAPQGSA